MKKFAVTLLLALITAAICVVPAFAQQAFAAGTNRNVYTDLDHSYDDAIAAALLAGETDLTDDKYGLTKNTYARQIQYVYLSRPEITGVKDFYRSYLLANDQTKGYYVVYQKDGGNMIDRLPQVKAEIDALVPAGASDLQKALIAHDYIAATTAYDQAALDNDIWNQYDYDASGVFVKHFSCCQGYSLAYKYILNYLGVECAVVESNGAGHAWNVVKIDGEWYHVDITADDKAWDILGHVEHEYFLLSTETLLSKSSARSDFIVIPDDYTIVFTDDTCATSKKYESGQLWSGSNSVCHVYNGSTYAIGADGGLYKDGELYFLPDEHMAWHPYGNIYASYFETYGAISGQGRTIYMLSPKHVYAIDLITDEKQIVYTLPEDVDYGTQIFGLARIEGQLYITQDVDTPKGNETWIALTVPEPLPEPEPEPGDDPGDEPGDEPIVDPEPEYTEAIPVVLEEGETVTLANSASGLQAGYTAQLLDPDIAAVTVSDKNEPGTPATEASVSKLTNFAAGQYIIGSSAGKYLVKNGTKIAVTTDINAATRWQVSGSASSLTITADGYYLVHSTSSVSLSTSSSNSAWMYSSSNGFYFQQSKKVLWSTKTTTYYLTCGNSAAVSTSKSNLVAEYAFVEGTPAVPGKAYTEVSFKGLAAGTTRVLVGTTLYNITVMEKPPVIQTITVYTKDDAGKTLAPSYTISGEAGTPYSIVPSAIANYDTPAAIYGTYTEAETASITLRYVLNTDKSGLKAELDGQLSSGAYTADSYSAYSSAISAGQTVYNDSRALQVDVDLAVQAIQSAKAELVEKPAAAFKLDTDGIDSGYEYVIASSGKALAVVDGKIAYVTVTVSGGEIASVDDNCVWIISSSGSGCTIKNKATGQYLSYTSSGSFFSKKCTLGLSSSATTWKATKSGSNMRFSVTAGMSTYYLSYSSGYTMGTSSSKGNLAIYKQA